MKVAILRASAIGLALGTLVSGGAWAADRDVQVCYRDEINKETRLVLDVKFHSKLDTYDRRLKQRVWDADGKHTFSTDGGKTSYMAVFDGAVVTSSGSYKVPKGSHLGGTSYFVRDPKGLGPQGGTTHPIDWECTSAEESPAPREWLCTVRADNFHPQEADFVPSKLKRLDYPDELCDAFQDTDKRY
jgi:hypothetical protein